jgi:hypothetical protein
MLFLGRGAVSGGRESRSAELQRRVVGNCISELIPVTALSFTSRSATANRSRISSGVALC